jgi:hypothetical protein
MESFKRWLILLMAGFIGTSAAIGYGFLSYPASVEASKLLSKSDAEWVKMATVMEVCVVLFGTMYLSGGVLALMLNAWGLAKEIKENGRWHTNILGVALVLLTLLRVWVSHQGAWRRYDNVVGFGAMAIMIVLVFLFKLGIGRKPPETPDDPDFADPEKPPPSGA